MVLTSPDGPRFTHAMAERLSALGHVVILCGRYEGVDERVRRHLATEEISIGDYVLTGGELPALVIVDAVARLVPGVVGDERRWRATRSRAGCWTFRSTRGRRSSRACAVPPVLLSGHHAEIERWRRREALRADARAAAGPAGRDGGSSDEQKIAASCCE